MSAAHLCVRSVNVLKVFRSLRSLHMQMSVQEDLMEGEMMLMTTLIMTNGDLNCRRLAGSEGERRAATGLLSDSYRGAEMQRGGYQPRYCGDGKQQKLLTQYKNGVFLLDVRIQKVLEFGEVAQPVVT